MVKAKPKEMANYVIAIPDKQDIANNGIAVESTFIGIPIINKIKLFNNYVFAGGKFDPRLKDAAINGASHDWASVTITGPQGTFVGITEINWKSSQKKKRTYGKGLLPRGAAR
ncbi:hypothetical protein ADUPG1_003653, partial [Aduncisulcus paluster]